MDYREIIESNDSVIIKGVKNFNIKQILECGQCLDGKGLLILII